MVNDIQRYAASRHGHYRNGSSGRSRGVSHRNDRSGSVLDDRRSRSKSSKYPKNEIKRVSNRDTYEKLRGRKTERYERVRRAHEKQATSDSYRNGGRSRSSRDSDYSSGSSGSEKRESKRRNHGRLLATGSSGVNNDDRPPLTEEQLDAELDAYMAEVKKLKQEKQMIWRE